MLPDPVMLLTAVAALAVVLALIWLAARAVRLVGFSPQAGGGRRLRLVDSLALDPRRRLHLIACDQRQVLLLTGGGADLVVGWPAGPGLGPGPGDGRGAAASDAEPVP